MATPHIMYGIFAGLIARAILHSLTADLALRTIEDYIALLLVQSRFSEHELRTMAARWDSTHPGSPLGQQNAVLSAVQRVHSLLPYDYVSEQAPPLHAPTWPQIRPDALKAARDSYKPIVRSITSDPPSTHRTDESGEDIRPASPDVEIYLPSSDDDAP